MTTSKKTGHKPAVKSNLIPKDTVYEVEVLDGLAPICRREMTSLLGARVVLIDSRDPDRIACSYSGPRGILNTLRTAVAVFEVLYFKVPHPGSIISGLEGRRLFDAIKSINASRTFRSFRIGAAGSDSEVFRRARRLITQHTGLLCDDEDGEMSIRFRRSRLHRFGWDVLIRLTPLPLSARVWRVENMPGAVNATIAAAMVYLLDPHPQDRFLNLMCGSGTILAERGAIGPASELIGIDISGPNLAKARKNLRNLAGVQLLREDASTISCADSSVNAICADLPWGRLVGEREKLQQCYFKTLEEMTRVCAIDGKAVVLTQENQLFDNALSRLKGSWSVEQSFRVKQSDYKPKLYVLRRTRAVL